jgi:adenosylcobinamide-GDP ribazoletransferase
LSIWNKFAFALTFLTRIPLPVKIEFDDSLPSQSMGFYPLIGLIIGFILFTFDLFARGFLPSRLTNVFLLILFVYITGGLHLDGLIDTADGILSCREKERVLEIMHDSLIGSFGALTLFLTLFLKYNLLMELQGPYRSGVLILIPVISRWMIVFAAKCYPLATSSKLGKGFNYKLGYKQIIEATGILLITFLLNYFLFDFSVLLALLIFGGSLIITIVFSQNIINKIGGLTGEINEVVVLLLFLIFT